MTCYGQNPIRSKPTVHSSRSRAIAYIILACLLCCTGCTAGPNVPTPPPTIARLPTVTPEPPAALAPTARIIRLGGTPLPTPSLTAVPTPAITTDGVITASMAQLGLSAEPYAVLGDPAAPVTIVEFTDFGCVFCRRHHLLTFRALVEEYIATGKVFYVVKHLPVSSPQGERAALAAICAGEQGRYWEMHNALFAAGEAWQSDAATAQRRIDAIAAELGLDTAALRACSERAETKAIIGRHVGEAHALRVFGTPVFFINDRLLAGAQPIEVWRAVLAGSEE
ncbi:MAG: thioredoxin domain-containing protein [Chloroflexus sp.]|nr:thioredoxin domain-containing protein [Chloroflexus sp.]